MYKNQFVQMLIDLKKKGVHIYLTDEGFEQFLNMMKEGFIEVNQQEENSTVA